MKVIFLEILEIEHVCFNHERSYKLLTFIHLGYKVFLVFYNFSASGKIVRLSRFPRSQLEFLLSCEAIQADINPLVCVSFLEFSKLQRGA